MYKCSLNPQFSTPFSMSVSPEAFECFPHAQPSINLLNRSGSVVMAWASDHQKGHKFKPWHHQPATGPEPSLLQVLP